MQTSFSKYAGSGNDFILIDNRDQKFLAVAASIRTLCDRKRGIGADGLITLELGMKAPFKMRIYNSDGFEAAMCGNGLRCLKKFLEEVGVHDSPLMIETKERLLEVAREGINVRASMGNPTEIDFDLELEKGFFVDFINTGVPHTVHFVEDLEKIDLEKRGPAIRHHPRFQPEGTNVNFVQIRGNELRVRTFERGVEGETLACGTGAVASALLAALRHGLKAPITVVPKSLEKLIVDFKICDSQVTDVTQTGPAQFIFQGSFTHAPQNC